MHTDSVGAESPPEQADRSVLGPWRSGENWISLELLDDNAEIIYTSASNKRDVFGQVEYDAARGHHIVKWNKTGTLGLEQYKRDYWEGKFYYAMAKAKVR